MLTNVAYAIPTHHFYEPKHRKLSECEELITRLRKDSKQRLAVGIHEANHYLTAKKLGLQPRYGGSAIEHICETDQWVCTFGQTQVPIEEYQKLTIEQTAEFLVAGSVAERVILGFAPDETSQSDYEALIFSGRGKPSDLIWLWKKTLEAQRRLIHAGARYESEIFGIDRSVRASPIQ